MTDDIDIAYSPPQARAARSSLSTIMDQFVRMNTHLNEQIDESRTNFKELGDQLGDIHNWLSHLLPRKTSFCFLGFLTGYVLEYVGFMVLGMLL